MKKTLFTIQILTLTVVGFSQTNVSLNLNHEFNGTPFAYNTNYTGWDGKAVNFTRVQYYLSSFELTHDGGQKTMCSDPYVLGSANITSYSLGTTSASNIEGINFDVGVDYVANHGNTSNWPVGHPLAVQAPSMDWGWPSGYFFIIVMGKVDNTGDGVPETPFDFQGIGDALLRNVDVAVSATASSTIEIDLNVNIADWVNSLALANVGAQHNAGSWNTSLANNVNTYSVFTASQSTGINSSTRKPSSITMDYTIPYAPTIYYDLATNDKVDISVIDFAGRTLLYAENRSPEGNFFINKEFATGTYIAIFSNGKIKEQIKFVVQR